jgi:hypothetical protein
VSITKASRVILLREILGASFETHTNQIIHSVCRMQSSSMLKQEQVVYIDTILF